MADADATQGSIVYKRDQLLNFRKYFGAGSRPKIPRELRKTAKEEEIPTVPYGECTISGEQDGRVNITHKEQECVSVMCFMETWLHDNVPYTIVSLAGFQLVRADRSCNESRQVE